MNKGSSNSLLICISVLFVSFYIGATSTSEDMSMEDILNYGAVEYVAESNLDGIYATLTAEESNIIQAEQTVVSTMETVAEAYYKESQGNIQDSEEGQVNIEDGDDSAFASMAIAKVSSYVNITETASKDGTVVGKLYNGSFATVVSEENNWTKIRSGVVTGYVPSSSLITGEEVKNTYKNYITYMAEATVNSLNIRSEKSTSASKIATINKGTKLEVIDKSDPKWVQVSFLNKKGYISTDYVKIELSYKYAISVKEEGELQKAAAAAKLTQAATSLTTTYGSKTTINSADMRLLVCLVFCESGSEPYAGKLAVANVVLNRYHSSKYPNTIKAVIYQSGQFSPTWNGMLNKRLATYDSGGFTSKNHLESIQAVKDALDGKNNIGSRLYFNGYNYEKNRGHKNAVRISNHLFW
ncbi:MAG: hypothetical protein E7262_10230 [Lachnospiraceae bacterium]|nr:hypothetical protein [Lachnospiraceae bacterium]